MRDEIVEKLDRFLRAHMPPAEEQDVVYLLVEMRKVMAQSGGSYPLLKFYADWAVHSSKDWITDEIKAMAAAMYAVAVEDIDAGWPVQRETGHPITAFAYMDALGAEVATFLEGNKIEASLVRDETNWAHFAKVLTRVLQNQPLVNPHDNIARIVFEPASEGAVLLRLTFKEPIRGKRWYLYGHSK